MMRKLVFHRGNGEVYIYIYEKGQEETVLAAISEQAKNPDLRLDWYDAAVLSQQIERTLVV